MTAPLSSLPPERWQEFSSLLDALLEIDASARAAWLAALAPEHADLAGLLRQAADIDLDQQTAPPAEQPRLAAGDDEETWTFSSGLAIGPYRLVTPLGQGGMGEVWSAQRTDGTLNREVALKLPHTWLLTAGARMRLGRERDFLAGLSHPNIAQLYDAGIADDGQPWMALEKVDGQRIDHWCRDRRLSIADRVRLFLQVTDAVTAAHARLIVHRDIKPSNVLVTDEGRVKLLDFGIAKLINDGGRGDLTEITRLAGRSATPEYAAPEQLDGATITAATDVYALGVVLHELLCGRRPRPAARSGRSSTRPEDEAPLLASSFAPADFPAQAGGLDVARWRRALEGDLDAIVAQALAPAPEARYPSVERLASDLRRHLANEPISARHITRVERALKFARRNRLAIGSALVVSLSLLAGGGISLWQAQRATAEALRAAAEAVRANATRDFLLKVFRSSSRTVASDKQPGSITAREMLDEIVDGLDSSLAGQPEVQLELLMAARALYRQWYLPERASAAHARYRAIVTAMAGPLDVRIIDSLTQEGATLFESDRFDQSLATLREARALIERAGLLDTVTEANWLCEWTRGTRPKIGINADVIAAFSRADAIFRRYGQDDTRSRWTVLYLAEALTMDRQSERALQLSTDLLGRLRRDPQPNDWVLANALQMIGVAQLQLGRAAEAEAALEESTRLQLATFGKAFISYVQVFYERVGLLVATGRREAAETLVDNELQYFIRQRENRPAPGETLIDPGAVGELYAEALTLKSGLLLERGRCSETIDALSASIGGLPATGDSSVLVPDAQLAVAECELQRGRPEAALRQLDLARAAYRPLTSFHERALQTRERWAEVQLQHGGASRAAEAESELQAVLALAGDRRVPVVAAAQMTLAEIAARRRDAAAARRWAAQALDTLSTVRGLYPASIRQALEQRGAALDARLAEIR
ncbi:serine/threonine-protein kinase [Nevskia sp.]|uniref:serine/threonine-protein kinase n=1 Tax=Nevskia sp. TaxID=1929292 RepID=UPI003F6F4BBA